MRRSFAVIGGTVAALAAGVLGAVPAAQAVNIEQAVVVNDNPADFTPQVLDGNVAAIVQVGTKMIIGGTFTQIQNPGGGTTYNRTYLAAFDATTGLVDPAFAPTVDGKVTSMEAVGTSVIVGGWFNTVNGVTQRGITKISTLNGARDAAFTASLDRSTQGSIVNGIAVRGTRAYIGGRFVGVNKVPRSSLAALNIVTGAPDSFNIPVTGTRVAGEPTSVANLAVSANGASMVLSGNFTAVGGQARNQIAMIAASSNAVSSWATTEYADACTTTASLRSYIRDIDFSPDASYFVVVTSGGKHANSLCDSAARWEATRTGSGQLPTWVDETGGDTLTAVALTGTAVYVGGHQKYLNNSNGTLDPNPPNEALPGPGAVERVGIAALDPVSGVPLDWNPGRDRGEGVFDLLATADGLWVGSDTEGIGTPREARARIAFFPVAGGTTIRQPVPTNLPNTLFVAQSDDSLVKRSFTGSAVGSATPVTNPGGVAWGSVTGAFMAAGRVYYTRTNGELWSAPFNGTTVGAAVNTNSWFDFTGVTGATYLNGRLFYVKNNDGRLYFRWFSPVSDLVGSRENLAQATGWAGAHTLFAGGGYLFFSNASNNLYRVTPGPTGAPSGLVSIPTPGVTWDVPAAFIDSAALQQIKRVYGPDRIGTSLASSQDQFSAGSADAVVLARADVFADGLPGAALAGDKNAPLLLTMPAVLDGRVADEIARILPAGKTVYLLGGTGALSQSVENAVKAIPGKSYTVTRLAGVNRYATSVAIANAVSSPNKALLATGSNFPDALGAGAAAGANNGVVLLTANTALDPTVTAYLNAHSGLEVWAVGGPAVTAAGSRVPAARQIKGLNRYDTAAKLAANLFSGPTRVVLATGSNFPDGLSGGGYAANEGAPLLLVGPTTLPTETRNYLVANADSITSGAAFGGPLVIYESVVSAAELAIN